VADFKIADEDELRSVFRREIQRPVEVPTTLKFPILAQHYVTWADPSGAYRYLVLKHPVSQRLVGIIFRPTRGGEGGRMCNWCHSYGAGNEIGLLTTLINNKQTIGVMACLDLDCIDKIEMAGKMSKKPFNLLAEELVGRMLSFYDHEVIGQD
jgi:hypothetical protein